MSIITAAEIALETHPALPRNDIMKTPLLILGILMALVGFVWIGQGSGYFPYPQSSFMISQTKWVYYGACLALVGLFVIAFTRR